MARRKANTRILEPYWYNPDISLIFEMKFKNETVEPGTLLKVKNDRSVYRFIRLARNSKTGKEWIDLFDTTNGGWRSFHPNQVAGLYTAKRSRAKKT